MFDPTWVYLDSIQLFILQEGQPHAGRQPTELRGRSCWFVVLVSRAASAAGTWKANLFKKINKLCWNTILFITATKVIIFHDLFSEFPKSKSPNHKTCIWNNVLYAALQVSMNIFYRTNFERYKLCTMITRKQPEL